MPQSNSRVVWTTALGIALLLFVIAAVRLGRLFLSIKGNKRYWLKRASAPGQPGDFLYLALGDSVANGIGASNPLKGYVGLIAREVQSKTGRTVHVVNLSVTGATAADVIREQLPRLQQFRPDLVTLDVGANDVNRQIPEDTFLQNFTTILDALPADKTIVADLPTFERGPKQSTLLRLNTQIHELIASRNIKLAPIFDITSTTIHDWRTYGADFFHPSNRGHRNWCRAFEVHLDSILGDVGGDVEPLTQRSPS